MRIAGVIAMVGLVASVAPADPSAAPEPDHTSVEPMPGEQPTARFLVDDGAVPFLWVPLAGRLALDKSFLRDWDTPSVVATGAGLAVGAGILAGGGRARWYHAKGFAESLVMTGTLTSAFDALGGRRTNSSSEVFAIGTYGALFLHGHVLGDARPAWQIAAYTGIGLGTLAIAGETMLHDGTTWRDVAVGGLFGAATSTLFYLYQDNLFGKRAEKLRIAPTFSHGVPALSFSGSF